MDKSVWGGVGLLAYSPVPTFSAQTNVSTYAYAKTSQEDYARTLICLIAPRDPFGSIHNLSKQLNIQHLSSVSSPDPP